MSTSKPTLPSAVWADKSCDTSPDSVIVLDELDDEDEVTLRRCRCEVEHAGNHVYCRFCGAKLKTE